MKKYFFFFFLLFSNIILVYSATYTVTSTANGTTVDGVSLRWAITQANASGGADIISFNLGAGGPFTITLTTILPNLTDNSGVTIDGWENGANDGTPNSVAVFNATTATPMNPTYKIILANGANIATGLVLASNNNVVRGLVLQNFGSTSFSANDNAIRITGNSNQVLGCIIGLDYLGVTASNRTDNGIYISGNSNAIGNGTAAGANLISGMDHGLGSGVYLTGAGATANTIKGNMIGLQKDGSTLVTSGDQREGIRITASATTNTVGGTSAGEGNVISGNSADGVHINSLVGANYIYGNIIGPKADGSTKTSSAQSAGVYLDGSPNNIVGGSTSGARNIISANGNIGISIADSTASGNSIKGNYIGLNKTGTAFITGNAQNTGIYLTGGGYTMNASNNVIGGSGAGEGNVISGNNASGVFIYRTAGTGNTILGNIIGLQANGTSYLTSNAQLYGIDLYLCQNVIVGGSSASSRNIISGNETAGVYIGTASSSVIKGNYIGLDINGAGHITGSSQVYGVQITKAFSVSGSTNNTIGGTSTGEGNVISGNSMGISCDSSLTTGNIIVGNIIGLLPDGETVVTSNVQDKGIEIYNSPGNTIGGNTSGARNIISANQTYGVYMYGAACSTNVVKGNYIGINAKGTDFVSGSSQDYGVYITSAAGSNIVGGTASSEENVISGNSTTGIYTNSSAGNTIYGNIIGPQADGETYLASNNQATGIYISNSPSNTIRANPAGVYNVISGNETYGIYITGASSTGNIIKENYIGPSLSQSSFYAVYTSNTREQNSAAASLRGGGGGSSNQDYGIYFTGSAASNTVGGTAAGEGNVIAYNTVNGIYITGASTNGNKISANSIYSNTGNPINLNSTGNNNKAKPVIVSWSTTQIDGTAAAGDAVEVFSNTTTDCKDAISYVGSATADGSGNWTMSISLSTSDYILATARDASNNTSEFTTCNLLTLPIELMSFTAACETNQVTLKWTTASETNNNYFTIERTSDGINDKKEFIIDSKATNGNSTNAISYTYIDDDAPLSGPSYYRLKQTDNDGNYKYFDFVPVNCENEIDSFDFNIFPNPNNGDIINILFSGVNSKESLIVVLDIMGKIHYSSVIVWSTDTKNMYGIDLQQQLSPGIYFVTATDNNKIYKKKIVIK